MAVYRTDLHVGNPSGSWSAYPCGWEEEFRSDFFSDSKETWIISLGAIVTGWIRGKYEKIRAGIGTWTRAVRTTVELLYRETTNALSHCELLSIIIRDAGNTGTYHAPVITFKFILFSLSIPIIISLTSNHLSYFDRYYFNNTHKWYIHITNFYNNWF